MYLRQNNIRSSSIQMKQLKNVQVFYFYNFSNCNFLVAFFVCLNQVTETLYFFLNFSLGSISRPVINSEGK